jgi:hypothetical protein
MKVLEKITPSFAPYDIWVAIKFATVNNGLITRMCNNILVSDQCQGQWHTQNCMELYGKDVHSKLGALVAPMLMLIYLNWFLIITVLTHKLYILYLYKASHEVSECSNNCNTIKSTLKEKIMNVFLLH